jgi:hypothetical protein
MYLQLDQGKEWLWRKGPEKLEPLVRQALSVLRDVPEAAHRKADLEVALAACLVHQRKLDEARELLTSVLQSWPGHEEALWYEAELAFFTDPWPSPWKKLETRWLLGLFGKKPNLKKIWDGSPLEGRSVLVAGEGGLGDYIQFVRFAPTLKSAGAGQVIISAPPELAGLLTTAPGVDSVQPPDLEPVYDTGIAMLSIPAALGTTLATLPAAVPYLSVAEECISVARRQLGDGGQKLNVGIAWRSRYPIRSLPLELFRPIMEIPGVRVFALGQRGSIESELEDFAIADLTTEDLVSAAAAVSVLDLVVTVDTMAAHLAGALGKPVWLVLHYVPGWRWGLDGERTPWYPTMRLFRQQGRDWKSLFQHITEEVRYLGASSRPTIAEYP